MGVGGEHLPHPAADPAPMLVATTMVAAWLVVVVVVDGGAVHRLTLLLAREPTGVVTRR